jgi:hypothetical protein
VPYYNHVGGSLLCACVTDSFLTLTARVQLSAVNWHVKRRRNVHRQQHGIQQLQLQPLNLWLSGDGLRLEFNSVPSINQDIWHSNTNKCNNVKISFCYTTKRNLNISAFVGCIVWIIYWRTDVKALKIIKIHSCSKIYPVLGEITDNEANWRKEIKRMEEDSDHSTWRQWPPHTKTVATLHEDSDHPTWRQWPPYMKTVATLHEDSDHPTWRQWPPYMKTVATLHEDSDHTTWRQWPPYMKTVATLHEDSGHYTWRKWPSYMKTVTTLHEKQTKVDHVQDGLGAVTVPKN